jgi:drug/metabolite transporter (DMT)-like permease
MLVLGTLEHQPDPLTDFTGFANFITTRWFLWSHLINSILGAAIGSIGVIGLMLYLQDTRAVGKAITAMVCMVMSNVLNTSIFGVAAFAQPAMGRLFLAGQQNASEFYQQTYSAPLFATALVAIILFIAGGIYTGIAVTRSGRFPRWIGWVIALSVIGFVLSGLFFFEGQSVTSALLAVATAAVAWHASRESGRQARNAENAPEGSNLP